MSSGNVIKSATQAADPAVKSCTARPGVVQVTIVLFPILGTHLVDVVVVMIIKTLPHKMLKTMRHGYATIEGIYDEILELLQSKSLLSVSTTIPSGEYQMDDTRLGISYCS